MHNSILQNIKHRILAGDVEVLYSFVDIKSLLKMSSVFPMLQIQDLRHHAVLFLLLFHVYFETRPETLGHLIELDRQSKPLIIETEQFVKNTEIIKCHACVR